ncbi:hypothetical protein OS493_016612 [Desmophyllum pertusum]|uniref:Uncharacterized protein n=1 Tax=Desmophyllum pertusum TaxID=174260 RepID=A0A9W9ZDQ1_9CNID|nr:hypothetical protein OS493_016612 [Desmophyllum pertusum]
MQSPSTEVANLVVQSRDCTSSYVNYGCRSSTEVVMSGSKEILTGSQGYHDDVDGKQKLKSLESLSSSFTDLCKSDPNYKPEPLAGLLSPIRRAAISELLTVRA